MPLNKFANWGQAPLAQPRPPGLGATLRAGFTNLNNTIKQQFPVPGGGVPLPGVAPSANAGVVLVALSSAQAALSDVKLRSLQAVNAALGGAPPRTKIVTTAQGVLAAYPALLAEFDRQWDVLNPNINVATQRLGRLATMVILQSKVLAGVR